MNAAEIEATAAAFEAAALRGEYFPQDWADRLAIDEAYRILLTGCGFAVCSGRAGKLD